MRFIGKLSPATPALRLQTQHDQYPGRSGEDSHERAHSRKAEMKQVCQTSEDEPDAQ